MWIGLNRQIGMKRDGKRRERRTIFPSRSREGGELVEIPRQTIAAKFIITSPLRNASNKLTLIITSLSLWSTWPTNTIHCLFIPFHFLRLYSFLSTFFLSFLSSIYSSSAPCISLFNFSSFTDSRLEIEGWVFLFVHFYREKSSVSRQRVIV